MKNKKFFNKRIINFNDIVIIKNGRITSLEIEKLIEKDLKLIHKQAKIRKFKIKKIK